MEWVKILKSYDRVLVEAARDHGKSWFFSYAYPLFRIQQIGAQGINIALVSYSEDQAKKNLARVRKEAENNIWLKRMLPQSASYVWDSTQLNFKNESVVESFGFGSSIRGGHYHVIIVDDPCKDHSTMSLSEQINFFYGVIIPALRKGGKLVVTGNPVEKKDLMEDIERNPEFKSFFYPAFSEKYDALWPEQYSRSDLEEKRRIIPAHIFAREYLLKRVSSEDSRFKESWIKYYKPESIEGIGLYKVMTIDPALSPGGDALAGIVTGTDGENNVYVLDRLSHRGEFREGIGLLCDMMQRNRPDFIGFEVFSFQAMYKIWLEEEMQRRGISFHITEIGKDSKKKKKARIESLQPKLAQGKLLFIEGEHKPLIDQLLLWDPLSKSNDDDEIDALGWQVPLWDRFDNEKIEVEEQSDDPGTFKNVFEDMRSVNSDDYISRLFSDMRA